MEQKDLKMIIIGKVIYVISGNITIVHCLPTTKSPMGFENRFKSYCNLIQLLHAIS